MKWKGQVYQGGIFREKTKIKIGLLENEHSFYHMLLRKVVE